MKGSFIVSIETPKCQQLRVRDMIFNELCVAIISVSLCWSGWCRGGGCNERTHCRQCAGGGKDCGMLIFIFECAGSN